MSSHDGSTNAILIIAPGWIGDLVMAQGLLARLKIKSSAPIDVLAVARLLPLLDRMPEVRAVRISPFDHGDFALARRIKFGREMRGRYARAYVLPGSFKSAIIPFAAGIPQRTGYIGEQRWGLINDIRRSPPELRRKTARFYQAMDDPSLTSGSDLLVSPRLAVDIEKRAKLLAAHRLEGSFIALAPGAKFGPAKRWPTAYWAHLAANICQHGKIPVIFGGLEDRGACEEIARVDTRVRDLSGKTNLGEVIDLLSAASGVVSNDTGLMHIAAAVGAPLVAIYGSTSPLDTPPMSDLATVLALDLECSPCHARTCPLKHHACMLDLTPDLVLAELEKRSANSTSSRNTLSHP